MLGRKHIYAAEAHDGNYIGINFEILEDLSSHRCVSRKEFVDIYVNELQRQDITRTKISAAMATGMLWTILHTAQIGDLVICPDGNRNYFIGKIVGEYSYVAGAHLPHQRRVIWRNQLYPMNLFSQEFQNSAGSIGTISDLTKYSTEVNIILNGQLLNTVQDNAVTIENSSTFILEKHLEDFLVHNWSNTDLGKQYDILTEKGEKIGQQYLSDTGPIDILAISKDRLTLLVVELKRGKLTDSVVGQIQRYMGYVKSELAEPGQQVRGVIIGLEDDLKIRRALSVTTGIDMYVYQIDFKLQQKIYEN